MQPRTIGTLGGVLGLVSLGALGAAGCGGQTIGIPAGDAGDASRHDGRLADEGARDAPEDLVVFQDVTIDAAHDTGPGSDVKDTGPIDAPPPPPAEGSIVPPPPPPDAAVPTTSATNFAIHALYLGDTAFGGKPGGDRSAWKTMGYNIDGKITTAASKNVCTLNMGGGSWGTGAQVDGKGGIDNSFGANFYNGILTTVDATASATIDTGLAGGAFTEMIDIVGLSSSPTQTATGLSAQAFAAAAFGGTPTWTTADVWPIVTSDLTGKTSPFSSTQQFPDAYVVSGTWVSGPPGEITLPIVLSGVPLDLTVHQAVITFEHTTPTHAAAGIISGVLVTADLESAIKSIAGNLAPSLCMGTALDPILQQILDSSDILSDGTNPPGVKCDAISIGVGFTADEIAQPTTAVTVCPKANPCDPDAGVPSCDGG